jgi:hypothetical protein
MVALAITISPSTDASPPALTLEPWHISRTVVGDTAVVGVVSGLREDLGPALIRTGMDEVGGVSTWTIAESAAGETEAQVVNLGGVVYILMGTNGD